MRVVGNEWAPVVIQAGRADLPFLRAMLFEAAYWRPDVERPSIEEGLSQPDLAKLLADWGLREGDAGVLALGPGDEPVGAAWYRYWTDADHSYGYVSPDVPEVAIAVSGAYRGQGIGKALLSGLFHTASVEGVAQLSLSVERDNPACALYLRFGFREVGALGNAWTMVADVPDLTNA